MTNCDYHLCLAVCHYDNTIKICDQPCNLLYEYTCFNLMLFSCFLSVNFLQLSNTFRILFVVSFEDSQYEVVPLTAEKVLEFIEQAYPNPITPEDLAR